MTTSYPAAFDAFDNPGSGDNLDDASVLHSAQHANANDAIEAIQQALGINPAAFQDYTPVITQSGVVSWSGGRNRYTIIGDMVMVQGKAPISGSGTANNAINATIPVDCAGGAGVPLGNFLVYDASAVKYYAGQAVSTSASAMGGIVHDSGATSPVGVTPNFGLASGDFVLWRLAYERAT